MKELETERAALEERRAAFERAASEAQAVLDQPQTTVEDTIAARMRYGAAQAALTAVEGQIAVLDEQIATVRAQAEREATIDRLVGLAGDGMWALGELEAARKAANEALRPLIEQIAAAQAAVKTARTAFIAEGRQLAPGLTALRQMRGLSQADAERYRPELDALLAELDQRGVDLTAVRAVWQAHELTEIDQDFLLTPLEPFNEALRIALAAYLQMPDAELEEVMRENIRRMEQPKIDALRQAPKHRQNFYEEARS